MCVKLGIITIPGPAHSQLNFFLSRPNHVIPVTRGIPEKMSASSPEYAPGQWVWLSTKDFRLRLPCRKLSPRYVGPFKISRQISPVSFRVELPSNYCISPTFHVSLLKPAGGPRGETEEGAQPQTPLPFLVDGEEAYRVEADIFSGILRDGKQNRHESRDWDGTGKNSSGSGQDREL